MKMMLSDALLQLTMGCEREGVNISLEYTTGHYIPSEYADLPEEKQRDHIKQGEKGWTVEVDLMSYSDDKGSIIYPTLAQAVSAGLNILSTVVKQRREKNGG